MFNVRFASQEVRASNPWLLCASVPILPHTKASKFPKKFKPPRTVRRRMSHALCSCVASGKMCWRKLPPARRPSNIGPCLRSKQTVHKQIRVHNHTVHEARAQRVVACWESVTTAIADQVPAPRTLGDLNRKIILKRRRENRWRANARRSELCLLGPDSLAFCERAAAAQWKKHNNNTPPALPALPCATATCAPPPLAPLRGSTAGWRCFSSCRATPLLSRGRAALQTPRPCARGHAPPFGTTPAL